jgi:hypothetical protein
MLRTPNAARIPARDGIAGVKYFSDELLRLMPTLSAHILRRGRWFRDQGHLQSFPQVKPVQPRPTVLMANSD